jgi:hypothetical protein
MIHLLEYICTITIINATNKITVPKHKFNITEPTHEHCSYETSLSVWFPHERAKGMENRVRQKCRSNDDAMVPVASQVILYREDPSKGASMGCFSHCSYRFFLQPLVLHLNNPLVDFIWTSLLDIFHHLILVKETRFWGSLLVSCGKVWNLLWWLHQ